MVNTFLLVLIRKNVENFGKTAVFHIVSIAYFWVSNPIRMYQNNLDFLKIS